MRKRSYGKMQFKRGMTNLKGSMIERGHFKMKMGRGKSKYKGKSKKS